MLNVDYAVAAGKFVKDQLEASGITIEALNDVGLINAAGCDLSPWWLNRLIDLRVNRITMRQLLGLRRLLQEPIDKIIGVQYTHPVNQGRMAGLRRIRYEQGKYNKPMPINAIADTVNCTYPIIARIEEFSSWAVQHNAADINTPGDAVSNAFRESASLAILISLKWQLHNNIDDIMGMGNYSDEICTLDDEAERKKPMVFSEGQLALLSPQQRKHPEQVISPTTESDPYRYETGWERTQREAREAHESEVERVTREMKAEAILWEAEKAKAIAEMEQEASNNAAG